MPTFARAAGREAAGQPTPPIIGKAATAMSNKHDKSDPAIGNLASPAVSGIDKTH